MNDTAVNVADVAPLLGVDVSSFLSGFPASGVPSSGVPLSCVPSSCVPASGVPASGVPASPVSCGAGSCADISTAHPRRIRTLKKNKTRDLCYSDPKQLEYSEEKFAVDNLMKKDIFFMGRDQIVI